jgi:hypothetical protein
MVRRYADQGLAVLQGFKTGAQLARDWQDDRMRGDIAKVEDDFTPKQTQVPAGNEALGAGMTALDNARAAATQGLTEGSAEYQAALDRVQAGYQPAIDVLIKDQNRPASVVHSMGTGGSARQQAEPFSAADVEGAKARERARIYQASGREEDASRVLINASRARELSDQEAIRNAYDTPASAAAQGVPMVSTNRAGTGLSEPMDASQLPAGAQEQMQTRPNPAAQGIGETLDRSGTDAYIQRKVPVVINTLLQQGKVEEAKRYRDFMDSESGRSYSHEWSKGVRKLMIGDHQGALSTWQTLYNKQLYDDGNSVKLTPTEDGKQVQADFFDKGGKQIHTLTQPIDAFARQAGMALAPEKLVEFRAKNEAAKEHEGALLNRNLELERLRQEGRDTQDDRRDERLATRLEADAARRAGGGGMSVPQQRLNDSIDAARQQLTGMSQEDVLRKTQSSLSSGRTNPEFDINLSRAAKLATSRKYGEDPEHDKFSSGKANDNAVANARGDVAKRFRADPAMNMRTLGKDTPNGIEVMEKGKLIGYFR